MYPEADSRTQSNDLETDTSEDVVEVILQPLIDTGFDMVICNDITRPETGVPCVRMTVPGLEVSTMDPYRVGPRVSGF